MVAKTGQPVWLRDFVTLDARRGKPRVLRGFLCDVTAHAQLQERETLLRLLSESIDEIFWFVEGESRTAHLYQPRGKTDHGMGNRQIL